MMNMMMSTKIMNTVKVQHLTVGHMFMIIASKNDSSLALFSPRLRGASRSRLKMPLISPRFSSSPLLLLLLAAAYCFCSSAYLASSSRLLRSRSWPNAYKSLSPGINLIVVIQVNMDALFRPNFLIINYYNC